MCSPKTIMKDQYDSDDEDAKYNSPPFMSVTQPSFDSGTLATVDEMKQFRSFRDEKFSTNLEEPSESTPLLISKDNNEEELEHENASLAGGDHYDDESELKPKLSLWKRIRLWVLVGILLIAITINNVVFAIMAKPMKVRGMFFVLLKVIFFKKTYCIFSP